MDDEAREPQENIHDVEVVTSAVTDNGTVVVDDLEALVDDAGNVLATDEIIAAEARDGTVVIEEILSVSDEDGALIEVGEDLLVVEGDDSSL